jgi:hypothetical protein
MGGRTLHGCATSPGFFGPIPEQFANSAVDRPTGSRAAKKGTEIGGTDEPRRTSQSGASQELG